ncbi:cell division protein SepF [Desulforamulus hydrothermalis]|uniref:Cell division protein SepF n=1 Tax=Desulforamulus hydrothermalis Lam5 = DSM 18033 TaxID=1121428 RepID=K8EAU0_9FIRM|nr:cell division protein SepF [Desulforamulus hydrothermalis]CCO08763.1 Cell division protein SepF 1 [Desulforamulus hydrothermalis Lam5 = DSM 18033]SHG70879.1 cell division inhibitor SepF [Desulforamulus hydrothermalis Lam5 = DSM 18033]
MAIGMFDKILGFMGFDETEEQGREETTDRNEGLPQAKRKNAPVVSLHTGRQLRVVVCEPASFDEAQNIADNLKNRRAVVVNLERAGAEQARRIVDFISGTTFALSGDMQKVGQNIFLFVPSHIDIANDTGRETREKSIFSWARSQ